MQRVNTGDNFVLSLGYIVIIFFKCEARNEASQTKAGKFHAIWSICARIYFFFEEQLWCVSKVCLDFFVLNLSANCLSTQVPEEVWKKKIRKLLPLSFSVQ